MMKNIKFILFAVIMGIFMANTASASDEDDFYSLVNKCCDRYDYDDSVRQDVYDLWNLVKDLSYMYCFDNNSPSLDLPWYNDDCIVLRFSDSAIYPSLSGRKLISYGYFITFDSYSPVYYCNIYFTPNSVFYDNGMVNNLTQYNDANFGAYYQGQYNRVYHNVFNSYELKELTFYDGSTLFVKNYNDFYFCDSVAVNQIHSVVDYNIFDYHYFLSEYNYFEIGNTVKKIDEDYVEFDLSSFGYDIPNNSFDMFVRYEINYVGYESSSFNDSDIDDDDSIILHVDDLYKMVFIRFTYHYNDVYLYQYYPCYMDWNDRYINYIDDDFHDEYVDLDDDLPFVSNSPDDLDLPYNEISDVQNEIIDYIGFENDLVMLNEINKLDLSNVENKETALMLKFVGYELFIVRVSLSVLVVCLITGFAWKNFGNMYEKIKKGRSNL